MTKPKTASINTIKAFAKLHKQKSDLEDQLKKVKGRIEDEEPRIIDYFQRHGVPSVKTENGTVHLRRELWAGRVNGVEPDDIYKALGDAGLEHTAPHNMNVQKMSAIVRETIEHNTRPDDNREPERIFLDVYPMLEGFVKVSEKFKAAVRKS